MCCGLTPGKGSPDFAAVCAALTLSLGISCTGMAYLDWLAAARKALVLGTENFIARDADSLAEFLDPTRLLPLLGQLDVAELLLPHHNR